MHFFNITLNTLIIASIFSLGVISGTSAAQSPNCAKYLVVPEPEKGYGNCSKHGGQPCFRLVGEPTMCGMGCRPYGIDQGTDFQLIRAPKDTGRLYWGFKGCSKDNFKTCDGTPPTGTKIICAPGEIPK